VLTPCLGPADNAGGVDSPSGSGADDDGDIANSDGRERPGGACLEDTVMGMITSMMDGGAAVEAEHILESGGRSAECLRGHVEALFSCNTADGSRTKLGDWTLYCTTVHGEKIPKFKDVQWPPSAKAWTDFLLNARTRVSSYLRFKCVVGNVCEVAIRFWSQQRGVFKEAVDPRILYRPVHTRVMCTIQRHHGLGIQQVLAISMQEARNATHFGDAESVRGVAMCAAFCVGIMWGRRPRTLTAIRLRDVRLTVGSAWVDGAPVLVPCISCVFRDEKFPDPVGPRAGRDDTTYSEVYAEQMYTSPAYWIYRLLVMRGVFDKFDPIRHAEAGNVLAVRQACLDYFLFCDVDTNFWIDTAPTSVKGLGDMNRTLLKRMGSPPRGFSSHRSGFVSRSCILAVLKCNGRQF